MRRLLIMSVLALAAVAGCKREAAPAAPSQADEAAASASAPVATTPAARRIRADVETLADDRMQGRETGTSGFDLASSFVAKRFHDIGLATAGDNNTYYQDVPLLKATRIEDGARLVVMRGGRSIALRFKDQFLPQANFNVPGASVEAPAVFVGQGVHAPELQYDDFEGLDLRGKVAVLFSGAPARFDNDRRAFYSSSREKLRALAERGAIGAIFVSTAEDEARAPWARGADNWQRPSMHLRAADGSAIDTFPQLQVIASVSAAAADLVFADGPKSAAQLFAAARDGKLHGFDLPGTIAMDARSKIEPLESRNVVAQLPGSAPGQAPDDGSALDKQYVVFSAHLDHIGIGAPVDGDTINNGALDNALGAAIMLEAARILHEAPQPPKRSMLFVAVTGEEKGLLGAEWFATHPTVPQGSLVANINMDMPVLTAPTLDVVPIGVEHSSLQGVLKQAAGDIGVALSPDPFPEENVFVRSDQYAFIRTGVPAVYLTGGVISADKDKARDPKLALRWFLRNCYHQPCDDARQPIQYDDAARLARLNAKIGELVGDAAQRPTWNKGDFFGEKFGQPASR